MSSDTAPKPRYARNHELAKYLGISAMTLWRWKRNEALDVPKSIVIGQRELNDLVAWDCWLKARAVSRASRSETQRSRAG